LQGYQFVERKILTSIRFLVEAEMRADRVTFYCYPNRVDKMAKQGARFALYKQLVKVAQAKLLLLVLKGTSDQVRICSIC
jgi:hypothetical protein